MTKEELAIFKTLVRDSTIARCCTLDLYEKHRDKETNKAALDYLETHGVHGEKAKAMLRRERVRFRVALEAHYKAMQQLAIAAYFAHGCDHTDPNVQDFIKKAQTAGKKIGIEPADTESAIASDCLSYKLEWPGSR